MGCFRRFRKTINRWVDKYIRKKSVDERKSEYENGGVSEPVRITGDKTDTSQINYFVPERTGIPESQKNTAIPRENNFPEDLKITKSRQNLFLQRKNSESERVKLTEGQNNIPSARMRLVKITEGISSPTKDSAQNEGQKYVSSPSVDSAPEGDRIIEDEKDSYSPGTDSAPGHAKDFEDHKNTSQTKDSQMYLSSDYNNYLQPLARPHQKQLRGILIKRTSSEPKRPVKRVRFLIQEDQFEDSVAKFLRAREDKGHRARKSGYGIPVDEAWPLYQNSTKPGSPTETQIQPTNSSERSGTNNNAEIDIDDAIADIIRNMDE